MLYRHILLADTSMFYPTYPSAGISLVFNQLSFSSAEIQLPGPGELPDCYHSRPHSADPEDPDHEDKMPKNTRAAAAVGKASSSRHSMQDWSDDDFDGKCRMYLDPMPLANAFPTMPSSAIPDNEVVDAAPLKQGPPPGTRAGKKRGVKPRAETAKRNKRQKIGVPIPKK
jgi:hypothetical protein